MDFVTNNNKITLNNGYLIEFEYPIKETLTIADVVIIVLDPPSNNTYNQNVFAITNSGDFLWRIAETPLLGSSFGTHDDCPYIGATINQEKELVLFNWCDTAVIVDHRTGSILKKYQTK